MTLISVLIVDDDPTFRRIAKHFLQERHHHEVTVIGMASGGEQGLAQAQDLQPDIVLIDLAMPDLPGLEAIPRLRAALPQLGIIALSLLSVDGYLQAALEAGADDFVPKATMNTELLPAIRRVMQSKKSRERAAEKYTLEQSDQGAQDEQAAAGVE